MKSFFFPCSVGVSCYKQGRYALVAIDERGGKRLRSGRTKNKIIFLNFPIIRGISYFFCGIVALFSTFWQSFFLSPVQTGKVTDKVSGKLNVKKESVIISVLLVLAFLVSIFFYGYLPSRLSFALIGLSMNFVLRNFLIALSKVLILFLMLLILRFMPFMSDLYKFNGACNQVRVRSGATNGNKRDYLAPYNILNIVVFTFLLAIFVITFLGVSIAWHWNLLINLGIFLLCIGIGYEIIYFLDRFKKLRFIGFITSFFVTMRPSLTHDEVARVALTEIKIFSGENKVKDNSVPLSSLLTDMQTELEKSGKFDKADVEWIIATVLAKSRAEAKLVKSVDRKQYNQIMRYTSQRAAGKPLSAIFGFVDFYGRKFEINKKVLSPRMETELLVEETIKEIKGRKDEVLDLGTGSGAIAVTIALETPAKVTAIDVSKPALNTAMANAQTHGAKIEFIESDLFEKLKNHRKFDIIVSNPPYIRTLDVQGLDEEVKNYDPLKALDGGEDGLMFYRRIALGAPAHLKNGGLLLLEIGQGQSKDVVKILEDAGFQVVMQKKDYLKIIRVIKAKYDKRK